jgi:hypothetical protein
MGLHLKENILADFTERAREDDIIEFRAGFLPERERDMLLAVWVHHEPVARVARAYGVTPMTVRRTMRRLIRLVHSEDFVAAAGLANYLPDPQARLARLVFCQRVGIRQAAATLGLTYHRARRMLLEVKGFLDGIRRLQSREVPPDRRREVLALVGGTARPKEAEEE